MTETPFYFPSSRGERLFGVIHEAGSSNSGEGFVFCHPLAEEKLWTHRVFVAFARELAARGYPVLRFDMAGEGDSDGRFEASTIETRLDDIATAMARLREHAGRALIGLVGLRLGATLAHRVAARAADGIGHLVLWEPLVSGEAYLQELLRTNLANQMAVQGRVSITRKELAAQLDAGAPVNVEGYPVTARLAQGLRELSLDGAGGTNAMHSLLLQVGREDQPVREELRRLSDAEPSGQVAAVAEQPFWRETRFFFGRSSALFEPTLSWLDATHV